MKFIIDSKSFTIKNESNSIDNRKKINKEIPNKKEIIVIWISEKIKRVSSRDLSFYLTDIYRT